MVHRFNKPTGPTRSMPDFGGLDRELLLTLAGLIQSRWDGILHELRASIPPRLLLGAGPAWRFAAANASGKTHGFLSSTRLGCRFLAVRGLLRAKESPATLKSLRQRDDEAKGVTGLPRVGTQCNVVRLQPRFGNGGHDGVVLPIFLAGRRPRGAGTRTGTFVLAKQTVVRGKSGIHGKPAAFDAA